MKDKLQTQIGDILKNLGVENPKVSFDYPEMKFGDLSTSVAMAYAKEIGYKSIDLAEEIRDQLWDKKIRHVERIDAVLPGFLNFFFDADYFGKLKFDLIEFNKGKKFFIEHTQPNPFKEFHIGHLMNNTIGESLARIVKASGAEVKTASYHGDVGLHVAKAVWAMHKGINNKEAYAYGNKQYEENEAVKQEIIEINKKIYDKSDSEINTLYENGRRESLEYFETLYKKLGSGFGYHFYESQSGEIGKKIVKEHVGDVFEKSDGAVVFKGENFGLHTRVFLNSDGLPTYEAKEVGLAEIKKEKFPFDLSLTVTGNEQDSFFDVVEVAIGEIFSELKGKLKHISHGMLKLPSGKMSSRTGNIITAENLIDQVKEKIKQKIDDDYISEIIAIAAIKYSILRQAIGGDIIFDFDKSLSFEGDSGPYLQYATVRANSLLKKTEGVVECSDELPSGWKTTNLERFLCRFPDVVECSAKEYAPHHIVTYLIELAGEFNSFYATHKIIDAADPTSTYRVALTKAFEQVMTSGLYLLGIKVPERM